MCRWDPHCENDARENVSKRGVCCIHGNGIRQSRLRGDVGCTGVYGLDGRLPDEMKASCREAKPFVKVTCGRKCQNSPKFWNFHPLL